MIGQAAARVRRGVATAATAALATKAGGAALPASVQASSSQCHPGWFCMWRDSDFSGTYWAWYPGMPGYNDRYNTWFYVGNPINDQASSLWNRTSHAAYVSEHWPPRRGARATLCIGNGVSVQAFTSPNNQDQPPGAPNYANGDRTNDSISAVALMSWDPSPCMTQQTMGYAADQADGAYKAKK